MMSEVLINGSINECEILILKYYIKTPNQAKNQDQTYFILKNDFENSVS